MPLILNSDLIEHIEITPDTVIALTSGQRYLVLESAQEIIERVKAFRRDILAPAAHPLPSEKEGSSPCRKSGL